LSAGIPDEFKLLKVLPVGFICFYPGLYFLSFSGRCFVQQVFYQQVIIDMFRALFQLRWY
jgi:hypothetical protein